MKAKNIVTLVCLITLGYLIFQSTAGSREEAIAVGQLSVNHIQSIKGGDCGGGSQIGGGYSCETSARGDCICGAIIIDLCKHRYSGCGQEANTACSGGCTGNCSTTAGACEGSENYVTCSYEALCAVISGCKRSEPTASTCSGNNKIVFQNAC